MYRNVTKSVKVNKDLLEKFEKIVDDNTRRWEYAGRVHYDCKFSGSGFYSGKFTVADLLEKALEQFIKENSI